MARVTIRRKDFPRELPTVCAVCGEYAGDTVTHRFGRSWLSLYLVACVPWACCCAFFAFLPPSLEILWLGLGRAQTITLDMPVCENHAEHWKYRWLLSLACVASTWVSFGAVLLGLRFNGDETLFQFMSIGAGVVWVVAFIAIIVIDQTAIQADGVWDDRVTLEGVHPAFVAAVEDADPGE